MSEQSPYIDAGPSVSRASRRKPWQPEWWIPDFGALQRTDCVARITEGATPGPSYYVLLILSTLIAAYGLLSNSTATVIGAMIVAPLMGPIVGLAMGTVLGDSKMFRRSLLAEISGVVLVILTGALVAQVAGVAQIDFSASEIANRTRPTLYDMAIGLAAGLAGSFCLVHPSLGASVAGVAIAVALVPPLTVTGLTSVGWLHGVLPWRAAFGSFMLFLANFLTIELASGLLFYAMGFRITRKAQGFLGFRRAIGVQFLLLLATGIFLYGQLNNLVRERIGLALSRQVLRQALLEIPGADLDSLKAELLGGKLEMRAVVGSRTEVGPETVSSMQSLLRSTLQKRFPDIEVSLVVRTVSSTYASSKAFLYEPQGAPPTPEQVRSQLLELNLRSLLAQYPGVEVSNFRPLPISGEDGEKSAAPKWPIEVTLRSPYEFTPTLVTELESRLNETLENAKAFEGKPIKLLVRTVAVSSATSADKVKIVAPGSAVVVENQELNTVITTTLTSLHDQEVLYVTSRPMPPAPGETASSSKRYAARVSTRGPSVLDEAQAREIRDKVVDSYRDPTGDPVKLELEVESGMGQHLSIPAVDPPGSSQGLSSEQKEQLANDLASLVNKGTGGHVELSSLKFVVSQRRALRLEALVITPKPLTNSQVLVWQKQLKARRPELSSLELRLDNRQGHTLRLTPSR